MKSIDTPAEKRNLVEITVPRLPSAADFADAVAEQYQIPPMAGPVHVSVKCWSSSRLSGADNLLTRTLRACEGTLWPDDGQAVVSAMVEMAGGEEEKTTIRVVPVDLDAELPKDF